MGFHLASFLWGVEVDQTITLEMVEDAINNIDNESEEFGVFGNTLSRRFVGIIVDKAPGKTIDNVFQLTISQEQKNMVDMLLEKLKLGGKYGHESPGLWPVICSC